MSTHSLTNADIVDTLAREGMHVSDIQLRRWYRAGLLLERRRKGRGQGKGAGWYWGEDTLDRARIIARTLAEPGATFDDAGKNLLLQNYSLEATRLRACLIGILSDIESNMGKWQTYLKKPTDTADKERRAYRTLARHMNHVPRWAILSIVGLVVPLFDRRQTFSFATLRQTIRDLTEDEIKAFVLQSQDLIERTRAEIDIDGLWSIGQQADGSNDAFGSGPAPTFVMAMLVLALAARHDGTWLYALLRRIFPKQLFPELIAELERAECQIVIEDPSAR